MECGNRKFPAARRSSAKSFPILLPAGFDHSKPGWQAIDPGDIWRSQIRWDTGRFTDPDDRPQNRSRFCYLRVLIAQNPVGKRLIQAIFGAAKFAGIQVGLPTPAMFCKAKLAKGNRRFPTDTGRFIYRYQGYPYRRRWCWKSCPQLRSCRSALHPIQHSWSACGS